MDVENYLKRQQALIEAHLDTLVPERNVPYNTLFQAARYALIGQGKRLRPILTLATTSAFGSDIKNALSPACALEIVHTYSLIHDDLPCMDDDDFRRGKPTLHKIFPEGHAVLTGDYLLTFAFEVLANAAGLNPQQKIKLIAILAQKSGGEGMIAGQVLDLSFEGKAIDLEMVQLIHRNKTGALITAAIEFGGVLASASQQEMEILQRFGQDIGLAFQIVDDVLDLTASQKKHGKAIGSDLANAKTTYATLLGVERSQTLCQSLYQSALKTLSQLPYDTMLLQKIAAYIIHRKS